MQTGQYYLMGDDGFGRLVTLGVDSDASSLDDAYENAVRAKKYRSVYIVHVVRSHEHNKGSTS